MTKDTQAKPSAGALRAAKALLLDLDDRRGFVLGDIPEYIMEQWREQWRDIIDRETGVAGLLEAAKEYAQHAVKPPWESRPFDHDVWLKRLEQAIARCEGKGSE